MPWVIAAGVAAIALATFFNRGGENRRERAASTTSAPAADNTDRTRLAQVYFESGEVDIDNDDRREIARVAQSSKAAGRPVAVTGHTDSSGDQAQNVELAKNRATAVRDALVAEGVAESDIEVAPPAVTNGAGSDREASLVVIEVL